ncbi:MAG: hypothetical protein HY703_04785 [Gemmatimonadetes bacterium]|nr:hypothetical protein [Gemmatimonadota bacterium]
MVVGDASPLIVLAKTDRLELLRALYGQVLVGPRVREEVVERGMSPDPTGTRRVAEAMTAGWIREVEPGAAERELIHQLVEETRLGGGEAEALCLASHRKLLVIVDDKAARIVADRMGLQYLGTVGVILEAYVRRHLDREALEEVVRDLTGVLWLSPEVVAAVLTRAKELR